MIPGQAYKPICPGAVEKFITVLLLLHSAGVTKSLVDGFIPGSKLPTYAWLASYAVSVVFIFFRHGIDWIFWLVRFRLLLILLFAGVALSTLWSFDSGLTATRSTHLIGTTLIGIYIGLSIPYKDFLNILDWVFGILMVGGALVAIALPDWGQHVYGDAGTYVWKGLQGNKNQLGFTASIAVIYYFCRGYFSFNSSRWPYYFLAVISLVVLVMSQSATSLVSVLFAFCIMLSFYLVDRLGMSRFSAIFFIGAVFSVFLFGYFLFGLGDIFGATGRSTDFTGRGEVWKNVIRFLESNPWLGAGYGTIWFPNPGDEALQQQILGNQSWVAYTAHNGFLQIASELGLPIAVLATFLFIQLLIEPFSVYIHRPSPYALFIIGVMCLFLLGNITEARFLVDRSFSWIMYIALPIVLLKVVEQHQST
jgi:exopolysaccharide production protein ExoQ